MSGWFEAALLAAFLAGLAGGAHCAAMCGGLVGIACGPRAREMSRGAWWRRTLAYNAGRIASYAAADRIFQPAWITAQAARPPALPVGSVLRSSGSMWAMSPRPMMPSGRSRLTEIPPTVKFTFATP